MSALYTEADYENSIIELFQGMGYAHVYGPDIDRDLNIPIYETELVSALYRLNPTMPEDAIADALFKLKNFENADLVQKNAVFMDYVQHGVEVRYFVKGEERSSIIYLLDYKVPDNNTFIVANQWTFQENSIKRPDVILFINGLPLVLMELKSPSREETDASEAYLQIRNYMHEIPSMFIYNAICVMSDMSTSKAGTITSGEDRFMEWKTKDGSYENTQYAQFDIDSNVVVPDGVTSIAVNAFQNCFFLESVHLPDRVRRISYYAFSGCTSLKSINIPNGVTSIEGVVFYDCSSLTSINLPDSVTSIDGGRSSVALH